MADEGDPRGPQGGRPPLPPLRTDGLETLEDGEPVLARWFVLSMIGLALAAVAVTVWGFASIDRDPLSAAERRPPGSGEVTIERGRAELAETRDVEPGPGCMQGIRIVGDDGSRAAARVAARQVCELIDTGEFDAVRQGLVEWLANDGQLRIATFELAGVESSARVEDERVVIELNAKFQFVDAATAAPALVHQLVLLTDEAWPGEVVGARTELQAARLQAEACRHLEHEELPRGCDDVDELLAEPDPYADLVEVGFRDDR